MREVAKLAYGYKAFKITRPFIVTAPSPTVVFRPEPTGISSSSFQSEIKTSRLCNFHHMHFCVAVFFSFSMSHKT